MPAVVLGHSLGGVLARALAVKYPARVRHVVTLGSPARIAWSAVRARYRPAIRGFQALWQALNNRPAQCGTEQCIVPFRRSGQLALSAGSETQFALYAYRRGRRLARLYHRRGRQSRSLGRPRQHGGQSRSLSSARRHPRGGKSAPAPLRVLLPLTPAFSNRVQTFGYASLPISSASSPVHSTSAGTRFPIVRSTITKNVERKAEHHHHVDRDADELRDELTRVAEQQAAHGTRDPVPSVAVAAVGEQPQRQRAPRSAHAVHRDRAHRIVDTKAPFQREHAPRPRADRRSRRSARPPPGVTNAHDAVIATSPPSSPLQAIAMSGLP